MRRLREEEEWARGVMSSTLGVSVEQHDDGSQPGMHDLEIVYAHNLRAAVEIGGAVDSATTELWNVAYRGGRWIESDLAGGWFVYVDPYARGDRAHKLRRDLPALLRKLEGAGVREFPSVGTTYLDSLARQLGVVRARQNATQFQGSIYVRPELPAEQYVGYAASTGDALATWVSEFLHQDERADLRRKLARSGATERHAFVVVATQPGIPFAVTEILLRDDAPTPTVPPQLPPEVTAVWIASVWSSGHGFRWSSDIGWRTFCKSA